MFEIFLLAGATATHFLSIVKLALTTSLTLQEHLPYADDSNAVTPMSEENGAIVVPVYYTNLGHSSRHSSYTSHASRLSYTSHGDLLGALGGKQPTKESRLRSRSSRASQASQASHATPVISQQPTSLLHQSYREYVSPMLYDKEAYVLWIPFGLSLLCQWTCQLLLPDALICTCLFCRPGAVLRPGRRASLEASGKPFHRLGTRTKYSQHERYERSLSLKGK